ncbi:RHS repeat domain-containing protein [Tenacibaculum maritimum]|uniref:RHS repeat domain-containing protein n=1 Tax=Tenacibaculum maritimum TaxID=107401 RepID=UPI00388F0762
MDCLVIHRDSGIAIGKKEEDLYTQNYSTKVGAKRYELANHLGNVINIVSDRKIIDDKGANLYDTPSGKTNLSFNPEIIGYNDYYPFGMLVPNRHGQADSYRYGFNGREKDDEIKGEGNSYDFGARMLDPRIGRWLSTDNVTKPWLSQYQFSSNSPLNYIDPDGNDEIHFYYYLTPTLMGDGSVINVMTLSTEIVKNNKEHTFFIHNTTFSQESSTQFYPFQKSYMASKSGTPFSSDIGYFGGLYGMRATDNLVLGRILNFVPQVIDHYSGENYDPHFKAAKNIAASASFTEKLIVFEEFAYLLGDGYLLLKGLSKFAVKELAKTTYKVANTDFRTISVVGRAKDIDKLSNVVRNSENPLGYSRLSNDPEWNKIIAKYQHIDDKAKMWKKVNDEWWDAYNEPWLDNLIKRGDAIMDVSDPTVKRNLQNLDGSPTHYARERAYLKSKGYVQKGKMWVKSGEVKVTSPRNFESH